MALLRSHWPKVLALATVLVLLGIPLWQVVPYYAPYASSAKVKLVRENLVIKFDLKETDKQNLLELARALNSPWQGQDLAVSLGEETAEKIRPLLPLNVGISAPTGSELEISTTVRGLPIRSPELAGSGGEFLPEQTLVAVRSQDLQSYYQLPGKEVFQHLASRGTLGAWVSETGLQLAYIAKVTNEAGLQQTLGSLKNIPVTTGPGYSGVEGVATGFTEGSFEGVATYTLSQPEISFQPTFGILGGQLVIGSSPEAWQAVKKTLDQGRSLAQNENYSQAKKSLPSFSVGSAYLDLKSLASRGWSKITSDVAPLFKLNLTSEILNSGIAGEKLGTLSAAWFGVSGSPEAKLLLRLTTDD